MFLLVFKPGEFDQHVKILGEGPTGSVAVCFGKPSKREDFTCAVIMIMDKTLDLEKINFIFCQLKIELNGEKQSQKVRVSATLFYLVCSFLPLPPAPTRRSTGLENGGCSQPVTAPL